MRLFTRDSLERMGVTTRSVQSERRPRVKLHRNAKTTPHMRALLVDRIRHQQWTPATAAERRGYQCPQCLQVAGSAPDRRDRRLGGTRRRRRTVSHDARRAAVMARIVAARYERRTAWAIGVQLQVPRSTVAAVLVRAGLQSAGAADAAATGDPLRMAASGATWCISMSNRLGALPASGIGFTAIAGRRVKGDRLGVRPRRHR